MKLNLIASVEKQIMMLNLIASVEKLIMMLIYILKIIFCKIL